MIRLQKKRDKRQAKLNKKKEEDAARLRELLALAGRAPQNSRPSTSNASEGSNAREKKAIDPHGKPIGTAQERVPTKQ